ncbi:MAG TPA: alpha/beta hydrolase [Candidatus Cybelea sp.]|jgi:pimeloyl-ACP methyl ester carboxylesterase|nr:alpha/beta hydrolase [Candidatus Cybelea sp.]
MNRRSFLGTTLATVALFEGRAPAAEGIDEVGYVRVGGIDQWIAIQGDDAKNPVLLYLHGGPAEAQSPFLAAFRPWEQRFTVVNWDQRGSGKTFERNGESTPDVTVKRMALDAIDVANYARRRLGKQKIIVVCQSFGCILGLAAVQQRPDIFAAYVGTGQPVNWILSLNAREAFAREQMTAAHDTAAIQTLDAALALPPTSSKRLDASIKWRWSASDRQYLDLEKQFVSASATADEKADVAAWLAGGDFSGPKLWPAITSFDARRMTDFSVPIFVIQGRDDHITSFSAAKAWVDSLRAPAKAFVAIDGGHFACFTDSSQFLVALESLVTPYRNE